MIFISVSHAEVGNVTIIGESAYHQDVQDQKNKFAGFVFASRGTKI